MREVIKVGDTSFNLMTASVDATTWRLMYHRGIREANHPVPAIPVNVVWNGYPDVLYIDDLRYGEDDPQMVRLWDFYKGGRIHSYWYNTSEDASFTEEF